MSRTITLRAAAPIAEGLLTAQLAEPIPSETRGGPLDLVVDAALVIKDVASVVLAVSTGVRGLRAALDWMRRDGIEDEVTVTVHSKAGDRSWTLKPGHVDEATIAEISGSVEALMADDGESRPE